MKKVLLIMLVLAISLFAFACTPDTPAVEEPTPTPDAVESTPAPEETEDPVEDDVDVDADVAGDIESITLTVWGGEEDQAMLRSRIDAFIEYVADQVDLTVNIGVESESTAADTILVDVQAAADLFAFPDDQLMTLYMAGALQEVMLNADTIISENAPGTVAAATVNGRLMAYPMTADNGYFMFYNSAYFTAEDVRSFDRMLEVAAEAGRQITMEFDGGWYNIAFFRGAGFDAWLEDDGVTTGTDINGPGGTDVVQAMLDIAAHPGFISLGDAEFVTGINDGSIIAGINGPWNAVAAYEAWGDDYAAAQLPMFTLDGTEVQMGGVVGCKLIGVNAFSENVGWAMLLAEWLTNYESQVIRFVERGQGPSNIAAAASPEVQADPALAALAAQSAYSAVLSVGSNYWAPLETLGAIIAHGNPDNIDLQTLLDTAVAGITS